MSLRVLVTAGPTREPIDAVRYISNRSSGRMGVALAKAAARRGHAVTLLLGPVPMSDAELASRARSAPGLPVLQVIRFQRTAELASSLQTEWPDHDLLLMAAAVSDHRPVVDSSVLDAAGGKLARGDGSLTLILEPTPDLLAGLARSTRRDQVAIGFALEPLERLEAAALSKLRRKSLAGIVANPLETMDAPMIRGTLLLADGRRFEPEHGPCEKEQFATWLLERLEHLWPSLTGTATASGRASAAAEASAACGDGASSARRATPSPGAAPPSTPAPLPGPPEFAGDGRPGDITAALATLLRGRTLDESAAREAFRTIMSGTAHHAEIGALLALLATRLPTVDELVGAARAMREQVDGVPTSLPGERLLDTAGTGGAPKTFNVSTAAAIVAAVAGARVAKHGNRSRTGRGSAEVLSRLGVNVDAPRAVQARCLDELGVCFCFAIHHHPAAKHAMPVRKVLGFPTLFNLLGPLTNPAGAKRQLLGVYDRRFVRPVADALGRLGAVRALVVHSEDGLDELSIGAPTLVADLDRGVVREYLVDAEQLGLRRVASTSLAARDLEHAAALVRGVLFGEERGPHRDMTLLAAAAALVAAGEAKNVEAGLASAALAIDSGQAARVLEGLVSISQE